MSEHHLFHFGMDGGTAHARICVGTISNDQAVALAQSLMGMVSGLTFDEVILSVTDLNADEQGEEVDAVSRMGFQVPEEDEEEDGEDDEE